VGVWRRRPNGSIWQHKKNKICGHEDHENEIRKKITSSRSLARQQNRDAKKYRKEKKSFFG
jgi:hypothetical protein